MKKFDLITFLLSIIVTLEFLILVVLFYNSPFFYYLFERDIKTIPKFKNIENVNTWCYNKIQYVSDKESTGYDEFFKTPERTLKDKTGDCDDYAILLLYIVKQRFNIEGEFISVKTENSFHAIARINGKFYDPTNNCIDCTDFIEIYEIYSYSDIMSKVYKGYFWNY